MREAAQSIMGATRTYRPGPLEWVETFLQPAPWMEEASCADAVNPDVFFPERGEQILDAVQVCAACPVAAQCLEYAVDNDERFGVWGGVSGWQRRRGLESAQAAASRNAGILMRRQHRRSEAQPRPHVVQRDAVAPNTKLARLESEHDLGSANERRAARAAQNSVELVAAALDTLGPATPARLRYVGELRIEHPNLNLTELGARANPPMSKNATASLLRRLLDAAARQEA